MSFAILFVHGTAVQLKDSRNKKIISSLLKETPKQYIEAYCRIFISALFREIF